MDAAPASNWYDFGGLAGLRAKAVQQPAEATSEISKQFESLFLNLMLKEMRKSISKSELLGSDAMESYQQMFDQQIALGISKAGGIGIAKFVNTQLGPRQANALATEKSQDLSTQSALKARSVTAGGGSGG